MCAWPCVLDCSRVRRDICANCFCSCELRCCRTEWILLPCLFLTNNLGVRHSRRTPTKARNRQDIRAEPQLISAVVTYAVPGPSVFYSPVCFDLVTRGLRYSRQWRTRRGSAVPRIEKFWANSVFQGKLKLFKILNDKNIYSIQWIQGTVCFSEQTQVAQKSWI